VDTGETKLHSADDQNVLDYDMWLRAGSGWQGGTI
jgi:hypothetical protein